MVSIATDSSLRHNGENIVPALTCLFFVESCNLQVSKTDIKYRPSSILGQNG